MTVFSNWAANAIHLEWMISAVLACLFLLLLILVIQYLHGRTYKLQLQQTLFLLKQFQPAAGIENYLQTLLEESRKIIETPVSAFYMFDDKNDHFVLKAVRNQTSAQGQVGPSYSGLIPYAKEVYQPPLRLPKDALTKQLSFIKDGEVPLVSIPIKGGAGLVRLGPISKLSRSKRLKLEYLYTTTSELLSVLVETENLKTQTEIVSTSGNALHFISTMALNTQALILKTFSMTRSTLNLAGGFILSKQENRLSIMETTRLPVELERKLRKNPQFLVKLWNTAQHVEPIQIHRNHPQYGEMALELMANETSTWLLVKMYAKEVQVLFAFLNQERNPGDLDDHQKITAIRSMAYGIPFMIKNQIQLQSNTQFYISLMKRLMQTIDNLNPYTVGYSDMMSRFSIVIAQELGIPAKEIETIALAAYLSNIGVIGLSEELYLKDGTYNEEEYEIMKLHAEVGANVVEMMTGDTTVANLIRYHHERMDGNGYPFGISGEQIPIGSRIIAVVQTFLAKINGRRYRAPLSFERSLALLQAAAGTQLDPKVVDAFIHWFQSKGSHPHAANRSLGPCWEMCCVPSAICSTCPAFQQTTKNCWEFPNNNCEAHGKSCETCFVKSEVASRYATPIEKAN
ncbi:HD domain-containing protein [Fodinisporobacter ferrooxydans]|uniref:HD domain-containing protein n=1 Tax=Fodinisporobacter ferrooxydans TaxID=2901836 RepID=A0ABY4CMH4_9BACL|nr:HD domain-containing protein [Alicyclobacillaceae bacterium MYW30-H2]